MNQLLILDRDGVINEDSDHYVKSVDEWIPIPGSIEAIARLSQAGYQVVVATNQSGLARGYFQLDDLVAMHEKMSRLVEAAGGKLEGVFYCPHGPDDGCDCRKPAPGLIDQIERALNCSAKDSFIVGDSLRDLEAGLAKGCRPVLVKTGKGKRTLAKGLPFPDVAVHESLTDFVDHLLR
ncbi:D-glycero-beta-D-manno-heptose 1,7-bisphosphate 7-phosphatase [Motiliproteus sp. SC1-56]|uniref:D-glycero-beta-D-manno-heptose 1,7-bisphosphate 7-phosphatase n=1 Tax=Motiliproteus sp. SC1-56 TaxID=2799565 RepID=UPI001A8F5C7F|nr:D-glycero-beta-D-manno-heptose 1,7-bisphosphate 7-phosphatase [Motiliproteus sp. SC1-56]